MDDTKITIIEGPTPTFEIVYDNWANSIIDGPNQASVAVTRLRTANGRALVERCYRAWRSKNPIHLEFRSTDGLTQEVPIVAARSAETDEGEMLLLWVRLPDDEMVVDFVLDDEGDELDDEEYDDEYDDDLDDDDFEDDPDENNFDDFDLRF